MAQFSGKQGTDRLIPKCLTEPRGGLDVLHKA